MAAKNKFSTVKSKPAKSRIVVVEDHPVFAEGLVRLIDGEADMEVLEKVADGAKALGVIRRLKPDLALVDLGLPNKSGLEVIKQVRAAKLPVKLLVVSMYDEALYAQRVLQAGGDGYIMKQEDPPEIINAIRDVLAGRIYVSEEVLANGASPAAPAAAAPVSELDKLSDTELEILEWLGKGRSNEEIAGQIRLKDAREVAAKLNQIQLKLNLTSLNALIRYAVCWVESPAN